MGHHCSSHHFGKIFRDSTGVMEWLHERIPAILPDAESVQRWLDPSVEGLDAVDLLQPITPKQVHSGIIFDTVCIWFFRNYLLGFFIIKMCWKRENTKYISLSSLLGSDLVIGPFHNCSVLHYLVYTY